MAVRSLKIARNGPCVLDTVLMLSFVNKALSVIERSTTTHLNVLDFTKAGLAPRPKGSKRARRPVMSPEAKTPFEALTHT